MSEPATFGAEGKKNVLGFCVFRRNFHDGCFQCQQILRKGKFACVVFVNHKPLALIGEKSPLVCPGCNTQKLGLWALWDSRQEANSAVEEYGKKFSAAVRKAKEENSVVALESVLVLAELPIDMADPAMYSFPL